MCQIFNEEINIWNIKLCIILLINLLQFGQLNKIAILTLLKRVIGFLKLRKY